jgi:hypothetical protein
MVKDFGPQNGSHGFKSIYLYPMCLLGRLGDYHSVGYFKPRLSHLT